MRRVSSSLLLALLCLSSALAVSTEEGATILSSDIATDVPSYAEEDDQPSLLQVDASVSQFGLSSGTMGGSLSLLSPSLSSNPTSLASSSSAPMPPTGEQIPTKTGVNLPSPPPGTYPLGVSLDRAPPPKFKPSVEKTEKNTQSVHSYSNKRGGKLTVVSNRNRLFHKGFVNSKRDRFGEAEERRKQSQEAKNKQVQGDEKELSKEEQEKQQHKDATQQKRSEEEKTKSVEEKQKANSYILRKDLQKWKPERGHVLVENRWITESYRFTWMFWIRVLSKTANWGAVFLKGANDGERSPGVWLYPQQTRLHIRSATLNNANDGANPDPTEPLPLNKWTHVAFSHAEGALVVYIDGKEVSRNSNIGRPKINTGPVWASYGDPANVEVSDLRYFPKVLSLAEILKIKAMEMYLNPSARPQ